ncbi:MAG TPA: DUF3667 domain-containing protein [Burkholderiaceae bacterium]|nr:DUF3667 domain-containing protein [Burkholderiaceae bacterium]
MSEELESLGALATASLAATAIGGTNDAKDVHPVSAAHTSCANCQAPLTGPFCATCGQSAHIHRSLLHLIEEVLHGVWHFDTKSWRTIPLLVFFPGRLTRRFIDGQRKNYVSPLALFLFMVFMSFFMASLTNNQASTTPKTLAEQQSSIAEATKEVDEAKQAVTRVSAELEDAKKRGANVSDLQEKLDDATNDQKEAESALTVLTTIRSPNSPDQARPGKQTVAEKLADKFKKKDWVHSDVPALEEVLKHTLDNPDLAIYKLKNTTYKYSFLLVPISLPFLWLMFFWRRGVVMFDHAVFVLYSLSFMSLLFIVLVLLNLVGWNTPIPFFAMLAPPAHMFVQLRGTYGLGIFSALWRTAAWRWSCYVCLWYLY